MTLAAILEIPVSEPNAPISTIIGLHISLATSTNSKPVKMFSSK